MTASVRTCVLYARLSVSKEESVSIDRQLLAGRRYAEGRGWEVVGEFVDDGVSATSNRPEDRKGWTELLNCNFDAVVIWKVDRLARRVLDFLQVDQMLQSRGAGLVAVEDPIDMTTPMGRAFATILAVFGEMEAAAIASRVKAARAFIIADGRWPGGGVPYGYRSVPNPDGAGRILGIDEERRPWLVRIVEMAQRGETVNAIARWLTDQHAPLPAGRVRASGATDWNRQTVDGILHNPILAGMTPHNPGRKKSGKRSDPFAVVRDDRGEPVVDEMLALLSVDDFTVLVRQLDNRTAPQAKKAGARQATSALMSKVARCDECDVYLRRGTNQKRATLYCPRCRQTLGRAAFDPYMIGRLLEERGTEMLGMRTVRDAWIAGTGDDRAHREVLLSQIDSLRIRRGVVGRYFDEDRVLLIWKTATERTEAAA